MTIFYLPFIMVDQGRSVLISSTSALDLDHPPLSIYFISILISMSVSAKSNQKNSKTFIPIILDNDFGMYNNFQI